MPERTHAPARGQHPVGQCDHTAQMIIGAMVHRALPDRCRGRIDAHEEPVPIHPVHSFPCHVQVTIGDTAETILDEAKPVIVFETCRIKAVKPEHLVALKLFAAANDPDRKHLELEDIRNLMTVDGIDLDEIREYFCRYASLALFEQLRDDSND